MDEKSAPVSDEGQPEDPMRIPASERVTEKTAIIIDDAACKDGGTTVSRVAVPAEQLEKLKRAAVEKTRDESGS